MPRPPPNACPWYGQRFAKGNSRQRRIGIVDLARKLLVALCVIWKTGEAPAQAEVVMGKVKRPKKEAALA